MARRRTLLASLVLAGCANQTMGPPESGGVEWSLEADPDLALVDPACRGDACPAYPNPDECDRLDVRVSTEGRLCGTCWQRDRSFETCGGSEQGLPYDCIVDGSSGYRCVRCLDLFGDEVHRTCPDPLPVEDAVVPETTCEPPPPDACELGPEVAVQRARTLFAEELNAILAEAGLWAEFEPSTTPVDGGDLGGVACAPDAELAAAPEEEDERAPRWTRNGKPRCGFILKHARHRTKDGMGDCHPVGLERALGHEVGLASLELRSRYDCVGSPLVLDLDGDGIETRWSGAHFDLAAIGVAHEVAWIGPGDALLALDRDGDGRIADGSELFGDATGADGFAALRALDADADGALTPADPTFARLVAWTDDGDAVSEPAELRPLARTGVARIDLAATDAAVGDATGSVRALWSRFTRASGAPGTVCDVFFAER